MKKLFILLFSIMATLAVAQDTTTNTMVITPDHQVKINGALDVASDVRIGGDLSVSGTLSAAALDELRALINMLIPVGSVNAYAGYGDTAGWLICDGRKITKTEENGKYAKLVDHLRAAARTNASHPFVLGCGIGEANLPDFRGMFLRGMDNPSGTNDANNDPDEAGRKNTLAQGGVAIGGVVGSVEGDAFQIHRHGIINGNIPGNGRSHYTTEAILGGWTSRVGQDYWAQIGDPTSAGNIDLHVSTETRPENVYVNYIIKY